MIFPWRRNGAASVKHQRLAMPAIHRVVLAALLLSLPRGAGAATFAETGHWISDPNTHCALFDVTLRQGDTINWIGDCRNGRGEGPGTASFFSSGKEYESFTGNFSRGVAQDGHVTVRWGNGWSYEGNMMAGRFNGHGVFTSADGSKLEGQFVDGQFVGPSEASLPPVLPISLDNR
jgi:hypothetical protein